MPPVYTDLFFKQVFENPTDRCSLHWLFLFLLVEDHGVTHDVQFTGGHLQLKIHHNSITIQNRTQIDINFFVHKDLEYHILQ